MIPINDIVIGDKEKEYVIDALNNNEVSGLYGKYIKEFEDRISKVVNKDYTLTTCNCTSAIHLALLSLGVKKDDEVIVPSLTNIGSILGILYIGAKPVFVDVDRKTWVVTSNIIEESITKKTKAIISVDLYGNECRLNEYINGVPVIQDAAESFGIKSIYGNIVCSSFYASKMITTGEGGSASTNDFKLDSLMRYYRNMAYSQNNRYQHNDIGYNYRMTNIQAAIGCGQIERLGEIIKKKLDIHSWYKKYLPSKINGQLHDTYSVCWMNSILVPSNKRNKIRQYLNDNGICTGDIFKSLHLQSMFNEERRLPNSENISKRGVLLPSSYKLTEEEVKYICKTIREIL